MTKPYGDGDGDAASPHAVRASWAYSEIRRCTPYDAFGGGAPVCAEAPVQSPVAAEGFAAHARTGGKDRERGGTGAALRAVHVGPCMMRGGAEVWLAALAKFLDPRRLRLERCIVTIPELLNPEVAREIGVPVEVGGGEEVRQAARETDVLICWGTPAIGPWLADCRPALCLFIAHGDGDWTREVLRPCLPVVDHVVAVSSRVRQRVVPGVPSTTILNGIDSSRLACTRSRSEVRQALGFAPGDFVLGFIGRFAPEKRAHLILEALTGLPANFKALLVGWGPLRPALMDLANELVPGRFAFIEESRYLGDYYQSMDAFCLVSSEEGFALVMLEAMMCGRPLIASPVGAVPEIITDRVNGLIVDGTPESIREAATLLHRHPSWAAGLAAEAHVFAQEHGHARRMAHQYETLIHRLWAEKHA